MGSSVQDSVRPYVCFVHGLKMYMWFGDYPPFIFISTFSNFYVPHHSVGGESGGGGGTYCF